MIKKEYEYRRKAVECVELAQRATCAVDKEHMLKLAEDWLSLGACPDSRGRNV